MDWLRLVAASLLSALLAGIAIHLKNSRDTDIKLAVLENRICNNADSLRELKADTEDSIAEIATEMKAAARELLTAAANVQALTQSQSVVNTLSTKMLDSVTQKVEIQGSAIAELRGLVHGMNNSTNHRS